MDRSIILALALGYLLGSIPFGLVLTRMFGKGDLRRIGSGNIGATNVLRTGS
jgi:glycerol-3-phosphate acyltransferase PlsY